MTSTADSLTASESCPPTDTWSGLASLDRLGSPDAAAGATAEWRFGAPPGTRIRGVVVYRYVGKEADNDWSVYGRIGSGAVFDSCSFDPATEPGCEVGFPGFNGGARLELTGLDTDTVAYGIRCDASPGVVCTTGATLHHAWALVYGARITLTDPSLPSVSSNWEAGDGWHRGATVIAIRATDNTGIAATGVVVDDAVMSSTSRPCDYSRPLPCSDEPGARHQIDLSRLTDGPHSSRASATDAAGNIAKSDPQTIYVDNHSPTAPLDAAVSGGDAWRQANSFDVTWRNPDQGVAAPIAKAHYRLCGEAGCQAEQVAGASEALRGLSVPATGDWTLAVWLEDAAGNVDASKAAVVHLRYGSDPSAGLGGTSGNSALAPAGLRLRWVVRRGRRLVVRGVVARGVGGTVVVRVRPSRRGAQRPRVAKRVRLSAKSARFTAVLRLPRALQTARRLRVSLAYRGDFVHRRESVTRVLRPRARAPR